MAFLDLFIVALIPVVKTLLITAVGLFLAIDRVNILDGIARHHLNNVVFFVFGPSLVGSSIAGSITISSLIKLWFMPLNILLIFSIGSVLGWILVRITRAPEHLHGLVIGCCAAGNLGNLLLIIIPAVCEETNSPFGDPSTCSTNGQAYVSLSMAIGVFYMWTYLYNILRAYWTQSKDSKICINYAGQDSEIRTESCREALLSKDCSESEDYEAQPRQASAVPEENEKVSIQNSIKLRMKILAARINLKMLFSPTTIATIVGLTIGAISPLRKLFVTDEAPLRVIDSSASMLGDATVPAMTLIVGANLLRGLKRSDVGLFLIIGILVVRYIALPLIGILVIRVARRFGLVGSDNLYQFVLLLQYALPPAMTTSTITQMFGVGESECSVIMLWTYAVASLALTLWSTFYMWFVSLNS